MPVPAMSTFYAGQRLRAADMNSQVRDAINWTNSAKVAKAIRTGAQPITRLTLTAISFNLDEFDILNWHDAGTPTEITPDIPGYYHCTGIVNWVYDAVGVREVYITAGATVVGYAGIIPSASGDMCMNVSAVCYLNGSTPVQLMVWHNATTTPLSTSAVAIDTSLTVQFIGT